MAKLEETSSPLTTRPMALLLMVKPLGELTLKLMPSLGLTKIMFSGERLLMTGGIGPLTWFRTALSKKQDPPSLATWTYTNRERTVVVPRGSTSWLTEPVTA